MKAASFYGPEDIRIEEVDKPSPNEGEIIVRNKVALTCGTDVKTYVRGYPLLEPPILFGHEAAGVVEAVGENVIKFKVGDRVVAIILHLVINAITVNKGSIQCVRIY